MRLRVRSRVLIKHISFLIALLISPARTNKLYQAWLGERRLRLREIPANDTDSIYFHFVRRRARRGLRRVRDRKIIIGYTSRRARAARNGARSVHHKKGMFARGARGRVDRA